MKGFNEGNLLKFIASLERLESNCQENQFFSDGLVFKWDIFRLTQYFAVGVNGIGVKISGALYTWILTDVTLVNKYKSQLF